MKSRGNAKRHFTLEEWADFARKMGPRDQLEAMESHLKHCEKCLMEFDIWRRVNETAHRHPAFEPPAGAVRTVKAMFGIHKPKKAGALREFVAELLFDSLRSPLPAGVRSSGAGIRQLLFGSGGFRVDLRIEPQQDSNKISLVGQVLNSADPRKSLDSLQVALMRGRKTLAQSLTNQLGEFHLECNPEPRFELRIALTDSTRVSIPLVSPIPEGSSGDLDSFENLEFKNAPQSEKKGTRKKV